MRVLYQHDRAVILHGDAEHITDVLEPNSVDSIVTDPPSAIGFMGREWDSDKGGRDHWIAWLAGIMKGALTVLKPGGYGLVWALPRTSGWTQRALEDAGFEVRDRIAHAFLNGFPKSLTSASAEIPDGTGTALKPSIEDWWLVRKPIEGTVAANFAKYGTGVLNIDACRIASAGEVHHTPKSNPANRTHHDAVQPGATSDVEAMQAAQAAETLGARSLGRWPSHLVLDEGAGALLDAQGPITKPKRGSKHLHKASDSIGTFKTADRTTTNPSDDGGGASRMFYCPKPSKAETEAGLDHLPKHSGGEATGREDGSAGVNNPRAGAGRTGGRANIHPTKKSVALMSYLIRLITPAGGTCLDLFAGSGTTGVAALAEGMDFIGVELTDEYLPILEGRIKHALGIPASSDPLEAA